MKHNAAANIEKYNTQNIIPVLVIFDTMKNGSLYLYSTVLPSRQTAEE